MQSHVYIEKRYNSPKYTPATPTAPKIEAPDTSSNLIPEAKEQMFQSTNTPTGSATPTIEHIGFHAQLAL